MIYDLPTSVEVCGVEYDIRSDYRAILDICVALHDVELDEREKAYVALLIFYPDFESMPPEHYEEAIKQCYQFIDCGESTQGKKQPRLMDWEQDFRYIVAPINRVAGKEIRSVEYMHWWTFISCYYEIGDCLFAQIVRIRDKKAKGKQLDKSEREFYRKNKDLIDLKQKYTQADNDTINMWIGK